MRRQPLSLMWKPSGLAAVRLVQGVMIGLLLGSAVLIMWIWNEGRGLQAEIRRYQEATAVVTQTTRAVREDARQSGFDPATINERHLHHEVAFANQLVKTQTFLWTDFLKSLEQTVPAGISLDSVRRQPGRSLITLTGTGASLVKVSRFVVALEGSASFSQVALTNHRLVQPSRVERGARPETVSFTLTMHYRHSAQSPSG